jgi:hypothetical protein
MKSQVILKEAKGGSVQVINNVLRIKDAKDEYIKVGHNREGDYLTYWWYGEYMTHSHECMKEYIVQQIHAGKTVKIEGEVMVIT